jgi:hypothetical protein
MTRHANKCNQDYPFWENDATEKNTEGKEEEDEDEGEE